MESITDLPFEPASIVRLVRGFTSCADSKDADLPDPETAGMLLWDLSADAEAAPGLIELQLLPALSAQLTAFLAGQLPGQSSPHPHNPSTDFPAAAYAPRASTDHAGHGHGPSTTSSRSSPPVSPARTAETCCGILANLYSMPALVPQLLAHAGLTEAVAALMLDLEDPPALSELCRLLTAALSSSPEGCAVWLPLLLTPDGATWLLHIISNTLHALLLERSLLLLAALLAVAAELPDTEAAAEGAQHKSDSGAEQQQPHQQQQRREHQRQHGEQEHPQPQPDQRLVQSADVAIGNFAAVDVVQQLLQHGLVPALEVVLVPAAAPGAPLQAQLLLQVSSIHQEYDAGAAPTAAQDSTGPEAAGSPAQAKAAAEDAPGNGWSDDDSPRAAAAGGAAAAVGAAGEVEGDGDIIDQHAIRVYRQSEALVALLSCLEQLGQQEEGVELMLQEMQELPQLLLQLMLACRQQEQHEVLELLLPVLVLFRAGVLPLLTFNSVPAHADTQQHADGVGRSGREQNQPQRENADLQEGLQCLQCWVCIAGVLNDCGPESLDAIDAAWYLLAAAAPSAGALLTRLCNSSSCKTDTALPVWVGEQLQQLCRCVCESVVPESAAAYARRCVLALHSALEHLQDHRAALQHVSRGCANMLDRYLTQLSV